MKRHQQIRKEQDYLHDKFEQKDIKVEDFVSQMRSLNEELKIVEQKMYNEHDKCILVLDKTVNFLQKENLLLNNKIGLLNISKEKSKIQHLKLIKKDKYIHKLKESIKTDYLQFNEEMIPKSYLRISKRFPHLNLQEIIDFEKRVRDNGGSIQVHGGDFRLTTRVINYQNPRNERNKILITWDCCHSVAYNYSDAVAVYPCDGLTRRNYNKSGKSVKLRKCREYDGRHNTGHYVHRPNPYYPNSGLKCSCGAINLVNPQPDEQCDFPETFYLNEEDEKMKDIKEVKVSDVSSSISYNIDVLEKTIEEYSNKILKLKSIQENLDLLIDT